MNHFAFRFIIEATINAELVLIKIAENNLPVVDLNEEAYPSGLRRHSLSCDYWPA